jgi:hypothetical protein
MFQPQYILSCYWLKFQSGFARGIGQGFDLAVIWRTAAVENHGSDAFALCLFSSESADFLRTRDFRAELIAVRSVLRGCAGTGHREVGFVVDELHVDVFVSETNRHTRTIFGAGNFFADTPVAQLP